ncbi:IS3 family transposase [Paenibacillus lutimineralis]|uniref:IS3 family transposase n=1 Tax=Paenibacillus lutimineralis TaxID=2707005 RepID=A0A3S9V083_9BACL|nr:IS3 family transposase [Paenibacillus lutimineralis]AZS15940.1 IS3 family transposase [Paenibacillus lutimineralis]AZS17673.1 IS3 family transposase [Paenibacillus lutimineralis]
MRKIRTGYTEVEIRLLESNPNVSRVSGRNISYAPAFKLAAVQANQAGEPPMEIFLKAGFNIELIGQRTPTESLYRWRETYAKYGEAGLLAERRGIGSTGRRSKRESSAEEKLKQAEARIKLLEAENELLKKLEALERRNSKELTPSERFQLINQTVRKHALRRLTRYLCRIAEVSSSGYYRWCSAEETRQLRETADQYDFQLIKGHFEALNGKAGALVIKMRLEKLNGIVMNHKKIRRIMRKFGLVATIRQANPYRKMAKATQEHRTCPNLLERKFDQGEPEKVFLTDITYMRYGSGQWAYLSCVKDGATKQILAHYLSSTLELTLVERTMARLLKRLDGNIHPDAIFHSDQGTHYTHPKTRLLIAKAGFKQSMSRKGNCWDNASMESFFGHMKDELNYKDCQSLKELRLQVNEYMAHYNSERYQWTLKKMTPDEFRSHLLAA